MSSNGGDTPGSDRLTKGEPSVLASLPSTRPQRPSTRRAAAREAAKARAEQGGRGDGHRGAAATAVRADDGQTAKTRAVKGTRAGAHKAAGAAGGGQSAKSRAKRPAATRQGPTARRAAPDEQPAPPQGFDAESGIDPGVPVQPPSGVELASSVAELVGELAQSGLSSGGRLLKRALARLPGL